MASAVMVGATAPAALKAVTAAKVQISSGRRPSTSDSGAQMSGPSAKPSTNREMPRVTISEETPKSSVMKPGVGSVARVCGGGGGELQRLGNGGV